MKSLIMVIILVISVLVLSCGDYSRPKAPDFSITDIQGKTYTLAGLENKGVIFLHFWSLGTPQNNQDMIDIAAGFQRWEQTVSFLSIDVGDAEADIRDFVRNQGYRWIFCADSDRKLADQYKVEKVPTAILITQYGIIWYSFNGGIVRGSDLDNAVRHTQASK